jgi:hypothetical protein
MTHDPMQTYAMQAYGQLGGYPGVGNQFGLPSQALQTLGIQPGISPVLQGAISPFGQGIGALQNNPYQNPLQQNPFVAGFYNPLVQHPLQHLQQNPLVQQAIQAQIQAQLVAQQLAAHQLAVQQLAAQQLAAQQLGSQFGGYSPWGQSVTPLAPQTWVGQGGYGQIHPLALASRAQYTPGVTPWAGV